MTEEERIAHPKTTHVHKAASLAKPAPVDIAFVATKFCDTESVTQLVKPYLAPSGHVVSLQNCINEESIADVVRQGRTHGCNRCS